MATPNLTTEVTPQPTLPIEMEEDWGSRSIIFEDGSTQSFYFSDRSFRKWTLTYSPITASDLVSLRAFLLARKGDYATFYWNNPETAENDILVRLAADGFKSRMLTPTVREATVRIYQVY